jgi:hypothetical protein
VLYLKNINPPSEKKNVNADESGIISGPNKLPKATAGKEKRLVGKLGSADRWQLVNATDTYVATAVIFLCKRMCHAFFLKKLINGQF